jgi:RHS repeat-associated protein
VSAAPQKWPLAADPRTSLVPTTTLWYFHDQNGSTRALTNSTGTVSGTYSYTPYGGVTSHTGTATTPLQFTGQYTDAESGLVYLRARYYDPGTTQFLTRDPLVAQTHSAYGYVNGNPLNGSDRTGLCAWLCKTLIGVAIGVVVVGTVACIIAEPCGLAELGGGLALAGAGGLGAGGLTLVGGGAIATGAGWGAVAGGVAGAVWAASSSGGSSSSSGNSSSGSSGSGGSGASRAKGCDPNNVEGTGYDRDEIAQFAYGHSGDGNPAMGRPTLKEIEDTLDNGSTSPGGGNSVRFDYNGVRVIVNRDNPLRSTSYYPGR